MQKTVCPKRRHGQSFRVHAWNGACHGHQMIRLRDCVRTKCGAKAMHICVYVKHHARTWNISGDSILNVIRGLAILQYRFYSSKEQMCMQHYFKHCPVLQIQLKNKSFNVEMVSWKIYRPCKPAHLISTRFNRRFRLALQMLYESLMTGTR